jgi:hypothetical protein
MATAPANMYAIYSRADAAAPLSAHQHFNLIDVHWHAP